MGKQKYDYKKAAKEGRFQEYDDYAAGKNTTKGSGFKKKKYCKL
jgi:hypothetical protein